MEDTTLLEPTHTRLNNSHLQGTQPTSAPLSVRDLAVAYHKKPVLSSVSFDIPVGQLIGILGPNGAGKSTLIKAVLGLVPKMHGEVRIFGQSYLEQVGMGDYMYRQISQLSGGQQQRVFLARALVQDADLYFMDEPFAGVDATTEKAIISLLEQLKKQGKTVLVVHHDLATVEEYFDHVLLLNGRLVAGGPTSEVFVPDTLQETYGGRIAMIGSRTEKGQV
jgi:manganese/zinc/iron transport system ATP- binding protein